MRSCFTQQLFCHWEFIFCKICYVWQFVWLAVSSRNCWCLYCNAVYVWCVVFYNSCSNMLRQRCCSRTEKWIPTLSRGTDWSCSTVSLELICFSLCTFVWCLLHCSAEAPLPRYLKGTALINLYVHSSHCRWLPRGFIPISLMNWFWWQLHLKAGRLRPCVLW